MFLGDNGLLSKKGIKAFLTELTRISDFLGESNSFGSQYVDSTVAQCLHVANQKLLNEDTFFKWFFKEPQIIVWLPTFYRMNVAKSVRHDVRCAHCRAQIVGLRYSVSHIITYPSKELCSKMALREVGVSLP